MQPAHDRLVFPLAWKYRVVLAPHLAAEHRDPRLPESLYVDHVWTAAVDDVKDQIVLVQHLAGYGRVWPPPKRPIGPNARFLVAVIHQLSQSLSRAIHVHGEAQFVDRRHA